MRIVLDTNILVRAHANARGPARDLLILVGQEPEHTLLLSPFLLEELERVLGYERVQRMTRLTITENIEYLRYLRRVDVSEMIFPGPAPCVVLAEPGRRSGSSYRRYRPGRCALHTQPALLCSASGRILQRAGSFDRQ